MRVRRVSVIDLFGLFTHTIDLRLDQRITIVHGPNGLGKTIILRMLAGLFQGKFGIFRRVPFSLFRVDFDNDDALEVRTETRALATQQPVSPEEAPRRVIITASLRGQQSQRYEPGLEASGTRRQLLLQRIDHMLPDLSRIGPYEWRDDRTGEVLSFDDVMERFGEDFPSFSEDVAQEPDRVRSLRKSINVRLIQTQRLDVASGRTQRRTRPPSTVTVEKNSEALAEHIRFVLGEYAAVSQKLDRTFPFRLFSHDLPALAVANIRQKLAALEARREKLNKLGFLDLDPGMPPVPDTLIEQKPDVFSIYVSDVEAKLAVFDDLARKIELLTSMINGRFLYKTLRISRDRGYVFESIVNTHLRPSDLSSGEQHELVLLHELLFGVAEPSLILIDEPEISLHLVWQQHFLPDLVKIVTLSSLDVIVATHSPEIIGDHWDLTVELRGPSTSSAT